MPTIFRAIAILVVATIFLLARVALANPPPPLVVGMPDDHQLTGEVLYASDVRVPYDYQGQAPSPPWFFVRVQRSEKPAATAYNPNPTWGAWVTLGISAKVPAASGYEFVDTTLPSLTSEYKYRMQNCILAIYSSYYCDPTWSTWLPEPNGYGARAECEGQPALAPPRLVVASCDSDGLPGCTGRDLAIALYSCGLETHECTLQALPVTYTDVNILIDDQTRTFLGGSCSQWGDHTECIGNDLVLNKVVIEGQKGATVFQGKAYAQPEVPSPVFMIANRPEIRVRIRNVTIDGNKAAFTNLAPPRTAWHGDGIVISHDRTGPPTLASNQNSCLTNLKLRNVLARGVFLADASNAIVEHSRVENVGCYGFTSDPNALAPCQDVTAGGPDPDLQNFPGVQMEGVGLAFGGNFLPDPTLEPTWGLIVRRNDVSRASSVGISIQAGSNGYQEISSGVSIQSNRVHDSGPVLLSVSGVRGTPTAPSAIDRNVLEANHASEIGPAILTDDAAVAFSGHISALDFSNNQVRNTHGMALSVTATDLEYDDPYGNAGNGSCSPDLSCQDLPTNDVRVKLHFNSIAGTCAGKSHLQCTGTPPNQECYDNPSIRFLRTTGIYEFISNSMIDSKCEGLLEFTRNGGATTDPLYSDPRLGVVIDSGFNEATSSVKYSEVGGAVKPLVSFTGINRAGGFQPWPTSAVAIHGVNYFNGGQTNGESNNGACLTFNTEDGVHTTGSVKAQGAYLFPGGPYVPCTELSLCTPAFSGSEDFSPYPGATHIWISGNGCPL